MRQNFIGNSHSFVLLLQNFIQLEDEIEMKMRRGDCLSGKLSEQNLRYDERVYTFQFMFY